MKRKLMSAQQFVDDWNARYPVGQKVLLTMDDGQQIQTKTFHEAVLLGGHTPVCWFEGVGGAYMLSRATPVVE